jgi:hypothetical protein
MMVDFERELLGYLVDLYQARVMDAKGRVCKCLYAREGGKRVLPVFGGFLAGSAAYLALTPFRGNPFHGSSAMFQLALDAGERLLQDHADVTRDTKPNHFQIYPLNRLYVLMGEQAGKKRLARWRELMARNLQSVDALIDRVGDNLGKPGPWSGTGPNHYFGWFAVGYEHAHLLGESKLARKIERAMLRHLVVQAPGGYFPEHQGPATGYQHVSLGGVAEFHRQDPLAATRKALERGLDFMLHAIYPNLRGIETFDERNRLGHDPRFQHALLWTPAGRNLFARSLAAARQKVRGHRGDCRPFANAAPFDKGEWHQIGGVFRCYDHAIATRRLPVADELPIDRKAFAWKLEDKGLARKQGPWFHALSAYTHDVAQGNPYHMDRTQALSVYHDKTGLIVGGGNDKRAYHTATIHVLEGGDCHYFPALRSKLLVGAAPKVLSGKGGCDAIEFDYGSAKARLEVRADSPTKLRIAAAAGSTQTEPRIWLVLQLPLKAPLTLDNAGRRLTLKKAIEGETTKELDLGRTLASPAGWRMSLPKGCTLLWPHLPWNPYRPPTYRETPDQAVALLRVPLHGPGMRGEVSLTAGAAGR